MNTHIYIFSLYIYICIIIHDVLRRFIAYFCPQGLESPYQCMCSCRPLAAGCKYEMEVLPSGWDKSSIIFRRNHPTISESLARACSHIRSMMSCSASLKFFRRIAWTFRSLQLVDLQVLFGLKRFTKLICFQLLPTQCSKVMASELRLEYDHFDYREQRVRFWLCDWSNARCGM